MKSEGSEERFIDFLRLFESESRELKYRMRLSQMAVSSQRSLIVDFEDLIAFDEPLARDIVEKPDEMLEYANRAIWSQMKVEDPEYAENVKRFFARFRGLPERFPLRKICSDHVGSLLAVDGIIVRSTPVKPLLIRATFQCRQCSAIVFVDQTGFTMRGPAICPECKGQKTKGKLFDLIEKQSLFIDSQEIRIQERPEELPPGQLPRYMGGKLTEDLVDRARPGDRVTLTGIIRAQQELAARRGRLRTFELYEDSNHVDITGREDDLVEITPEEEREIKEIARDPWSGNKMIRSLAPSIYGYEDIKESILYLLVGGTRKILPDGVVIRGELNVLLIGDPGIAKCVTGDTPILLADGSLRPIREVVGEVEANGRIGAVDDGIYAEGNHDLYSLGSKGKIEATKAIRFWKRTAPEQLFRITTATGRCITVTPTHPLFVADDGHIVAKEASTVHPAEFIATPRAIPFEGRPQPLSQIGYRRSRSHNAVRLRLSERSSPSFWRAIGLFVGEGYIRFDPAGPATVYFTNNDPRLLSEFTRFARNLGFRPILRRPHSSKTLHEVVVPGVELASFLESMGAGGPSAEKLVPPLLFKCSPREIAAFLSGLFDADGSVSKRHRVIHLVSASRKLIEETRHLLMRLGIISQVHPTRSRAPRWSSSRTYYRLTITGEAASRFASIVGFRVSGKASRIRSARGPFNTNQDVIPELSRVLNRVRESLGLNQTQMGVPRSTYTHYERGDRNPSRRALQRIVRRLRLVSAKGASSSLMADLDRLEQLAHSDIFWDRVQRLESVAPQEPYVYDVEVPALHNFIAGDVVVHNSQLLQYAARVAPRGVYTAGRGSTAAGLTAAVLREKSGGMVLEAGALVLADKGVCCIDEIEKMRDEDRVAIHEALEQNTVSVAKGGIVATLNARTSVLAAANPALGRYDPYQTVTENITLPITLLSRFDLIFVMRDIPDPERDAKISQHILTLHRDKSSGESPPVSPEILKKYISYAKRINPVISDEAMKELREFYLKMRSASGTNDSPVSITPRQLEALVRLAEARARAGLKTTVTVEDARQVIRLMNVCLENVGIDTKTGKVDIDVIMTGKPKSLRERMQIVLTKIAEIEKKSGFVDESDLYESLAKEKLMEEGEARGVVNQLIREGLIYSPKPATLRRTAV